MKLIDDIRSDNIAILVREFGALKDLAEALEKSESQVSQWMNRSINSGTGKPRAMRSATARYIETKVGKLHGWLDQLHDEDCDESREKIHAPSENSSHLSPLADTRESSDPRESKNDTAIRWPLSDGYRLRFEALPPEGRGLALAKFEAAIQEAEDRYLGQANSA